MDPQQQQQAANLIAGMGVGAVLFAIVFALGVVAFVVFLFWRVFSKAGLPGPLGLLILVPGIGWLIAMCILAFSQWRVVPLASSYAAGPPVFPPSAYPPAGHTPANYPPAGPTSPL